MECVDFEIRWQEVLDEHRPPESDAALLEHLHGCPACRGLVQSLGQVLDVAQRLSTPPVPAGLAARVLVELERPTVLRLRPVRRWVALAAAAAAIATLSIPLGYWIGRQSTGSRGASQLAHETRQHLPEAFWNVPFAADDQPEGVAANDETRWSQDVQTSLEPLTRSTAAALDSLWQAIPAAAEDSRT